MDVHGSLCQVHGSGVLLRGAPGVGKSWLCLQLLQRGHALVADDCVVLEAQADCVYGQPPTEGAPQLALRGVGIVDVATAFGAQAWVAGGQRIDWVIDLQHTPICPAVPEYRHTELLGRTLPTLQLAARADHSTVIELCCRLGPQPLQEWKTRP